MYCGNSSAKAECGFCSAPVHVRPCSASVCIPTHLFNAFIFSLASSQTNWIIQQLISCKDLLADTFTFNFAVGWGCNCCKSPRFKHYERAEAMFLSHSPVSHTQLVFLCSVWRAPAVLCWHIHLLISFRLKEVFPCQALKSADAEEAGWDV